jgi:hypothetical protein
MWVDLLDHWQTFAAVHGDFLVELRGFEPLTSEEQGPARYDAAVAVFHGLPPEARLSIRPRPPLLPLTYARPVGRTPFRSRRERPDRLSRPRIGTR